MLKVNPDNVATPIAASLGDVTTLSLLAWIADRLYRDMEDHQPTAPILIGTKGGGNISPQHPYS